MIIKMITVIVTIIINVITDRATILSSKWKRSLLCYTVKTDFCQSNPRLIRKQPWSEMYTGNISGYSMAEMSRPMKERKVQLCQVTTKHYYWPWWPRWPRWPWWQRLPSIFPPCQNPTMVGNCQEWWRWKCVSVKNPPYTIRHDELYFGVYMYFS